MPANSLLIRFYRKYKKIFYFITGIVVSTTLIFFIHKIFSVKTIIVNGSGNLTISGLEEIKNNNILFLQKDEIQKKLLKQNPFIKDIAITIAYPTTLKIQIIKNNIFAYLKSNTKYLYLSMEGRILKKIKDKPENIPEIKYYQIIDEYTHNIGDFLENKDITTALYYIKSLQQLGINTDSVDISSFDMLVCKEEDREIVFSINKDNASQIYSVEQIVKKFRIEGKQYKKIDVRFEKAIVTF